MIVTTIELENGYCLQGFDNDTIIEGSIYTPNNELLNDSFGYWNKVTASQNANLWIKYNHTFNA